MEAKVSPERAKRKITKLSPREKVMPVEMVDFLALAKPNYEEIWRFQKERVDGISHGTASECIIFCEHELVATKGRRAKAQNILDLKVPVYEIERGGDVTLHAPGQLVIYPLLQLRGQHFKAGLSEYLRFCEQVLIHFLNDMGLNAGRFGPTGVWIRNSKGEAKKIASLGVAVRRWITYHGLALNVSNDLKDFQRIRPCDFDAGVMTSLKAEGVGMPMSEVALRLKIAFARELKAARL